MVSQYTFTRFNSILDQSGERVKLLLDSSENLTEQMSYSAFKKGWLRGTMSAYFSAL